MGKGDAGPSNPQPEDAAATMEDSIPEAEAPGTIAGAMWVS